MKNMKKNIRNIVRNLPKPVSYGVHYDWATIVVRPTTDPALLFYLKKIHVREIKDNERKTKLRGYSDALKAQIASPIYEADGTPAWSGEVDVSYRRARRQLKYQGWAKHSDAADNIAPEDLETGTATKSNTFGDATKIDYEHGFYSDKARGSRANPNYPITAFKYSEDKRGRKMPVYLADFPGYDQDRSTDAAYNLDLIHRIDDDLDPYYECALKLSGGELGQLEREMSLSVFLSKFGKDASTSRLDLTLDVQYQTVDQMEQVEARLNQLAGMTVSATGAYVQDRTSSFITAGSQNKKSPLKNASLVASLPYKNSDGTESDFKTGFGQTLYLGSRTGDFFMRIYNKTADAKEKHNTEIPPTLRFEIEAKGALSKAIYPQILRGKSVESLFVATLDSYVTFGGMTLLKILKIKFDNLEKIKLDLRYPDSDIQRTRYIMKKQWAKKIKTLTADMPMSARVIYALSATGVLDDIPDDDDEFAEMLSELMQIRDQNKSFKVLDVVDQKDLLEKEKKKSK